jgi:hypothetical protein
MNEIDAKRVRGGFGYFGFIQPTQTPPQSGYPPFTEYFPNYSIGSSTSNNTIGNGFKTFEYASQEPKCSYGDLISITSTSITVYGEMLGMVHTYSYNEGSGISTIVVEVYQSQGNGVTDEWDIRFQLNDGSNIVQNPDSPHTAKLSVYDGGGFASGSASFVVPYATKDETIQTENTPYVQAFETTTSWKWSTFIQEDMSDIHKPWLGTTISIRIKIKKVSIFVDYTFEPPIETRSEEFEERDYTHTFTENDFNPDSEGFVAGEGHSPSTCENSSEDYIDNFVSTIKSTYDGDAPYGQLTLEAVTYSFDGLYYITDISPASFFEPPTP